MNCPSCGYCSHCGRGGHSPFYNRPYYYYPYSSPYATTTGGLGSIPNQGIGGSSSWAPQTQAAAQSSSTNLADFFARLNKQE